MYQQGNPYGNDGATKVSGAGTAKNNGYGNNAGDMNMNGNGAAFGSGYGANSFGAGGYGGAAAFGGGSMYGGGSAYGAASGQGAGQSSMYGGGSLYGGGGGVGSMMGDMNENIIVTKLFSSRRDLDRVASAVDFSRRFDSNWGSYRSAGADGYGGSIYGNPTADAGSLMNLGQSDRGIGSVMDRGVGAAGVGPDGGAEEASREAKSKKAPRESPPEQRKSEPSAKKAATEAQKSAEPPVSAPAKSPATAAKPPQAAAEAAAKKPVEAKPAPLAATQTAPTKPAEASPKAISRAVPAPQEPARAIKAEGKQQPQAPPSKPPQAPPSQPPLKSPGRVMRAREVVPADAKPAEKPREAPPVDDIPLLADDVLPKKKTHTPTAVKKAPSPREVAPPPPQQPQQQQAQQQQQPQQQRLQQQQQQKQQPERAREVAEVAKAPTPKAATPPAAQKTPATGANESTRPARPRSRLQSRPQSRMTSMSVVEFPQADEVKDEMLADGLKDPEKEAALAAAREEQKRQREEAMRQARLERAKQRQAQEDMQKQRDEEARRARDAKAEEERQKRELVAKMDAETRKERAAALAARERQREEEKRRFEEAKRAEEEKEAARAQAAIAERQRQLEEKEAQQEKTSRPASRPRSRRPASRPSSNLRGAIPEQPPDVVAGQIKDTLADENLGKPLHAATRNTPASEVPVADAGRTSHRGSEQPRGHTPASQHHSPATQRRTPVESAGSKSTPASVKKDDGRAQQQQPTPAVQKEQNMVKTFVLVEQVRGSNNAVQYTPDSITYHGQTVNVTELKTREEDNFNYNSTVVHDVREAACRGYNAAVLSMDAVNSAGRFDSPVWSILNRVVRTLLMENSNEAGELRENFELTCAMGYLYCDKVKDMFIHDAEAPFTKVAVNPSPIYGPRLTNLKYETVTDPLKFEELLSATLSRGGSDSTVASLSEGALAAFVLVKQMRETDGKPDIYLSSLVVASSGEDPVPYQSAISHTRNEYATVFHLVLGGPSCTCFMLNVADDDTVRKSGNASQQSVPEVLETSLALLSQMANLQNYDLRSGSVKRFIKYVERSHANAKQRLAKEQDESQRRKVERYLKEQERLLEDAYTLLRDANIQVYEEL
jgi:hypothetical protein